MVVALGALAMICATGPAAAGLIPFYVGPAFDTSTNTGYKTPTEAVAPGQAIDDIGTAVGNTTKYVTGGISRGARAVRWDTTGAAAVELGNLGTDVNGNTATYAYAANSLGLAVGYGTKYDLGVNKGSRAIRWDPTGTAATELGNLGLDSTNKTTSVAYAVNDSGTAVGYAIRYLNGSGKGQRAVRWDAGTTAAVELENLGTDTSGYGESYAYAINNDGIAVGYAGKYVGSSSKGYRAVRWDALGLAAELGNLGTDSGGSTDARAYAVNSSGTAVGYAAKYVSNLAKGNRAARWDSSGTTISELGTLGTDASGVSNAYAYAVNDLGIAVGYATKYVSNASKGNRAVRWDASGLATELENLGTNTTGSASGQAYAINNDGIAVGYVEKYSTSGTLIGNMAVYWNPSGSVVDLNTLLDPGSGWTLNTARSISNTNWVTGIGKYDPDGTGPLPAYDRLFTIQVPEPATLAFVAFGGLALLMRRRNRR